MTSKATLLDDLVSAEQKWEVRLIKNFGKDATRARYDGRGRGKPGSRLNEAYQEREAARMAWEAAV